MPELGRSTDDPITLWLHVDGTPCDAGNIAPRPYPAGTPQGHRPSPGDRWWCTEHAQHLVPAAPDLRRGEDRALRTRMTDRLRAQLDEVEGLINRRGSVVGAWRCSCEGDPLTIIAEVIRCDRIDRVPPDLSAHHVIDGLRRAGFVVEGTAQ